MKLFRICLAAIMIAATCFTSVNAQITGPAKQEIDENSPKYDAKYLKGGVPEVNGKVVLNRDIALAAGFDREATIKKINNWLERCSKDDRIQQFSQIDSDEPTTIHTFVIQKLVFSRTFISLDQCDMQYVLTLKVNESGIRMEMSRISYKYNENDKINHYKAEDMITDKAALRKSGKSMFPGYKKFRMKTIDLIDEYQESLKNALGITE